MSENIKRDIPNEGFNTRRQRVIDMLANSVIPELVVHGELGKEKNGERPLNIELDMDGRGALFLLDLAGIDYNKLTVVPKGESIEGRVNIDTGERQFQGMEKNGSVFFDHHGDERAAYGESSSATKIVYDLLVDGGLLQQEKYLDNLVGFITDIDNADYPLDYDYFKNYWWRSLYGLQKILPFEKITEIIKNGKDPMEPFTEEEAQPIIVKNHLGKEISLLEAALNQRDFVEKNINEIAFARKNMEREGIKTRERDLGTVLLNIVRKEVKPNGQKRDVNKIPLGFTATRALGFDSYIIWNKDDGRIFITSRFHLGKVYERLVKKFSEAKLIRGTMIIKPVTKEGEEIASLDEFLKILQLKD